MPGCLFVEESHPTNFPIFVGCQSLVPFTSILKSAGPVVKNKTDLLSEKDVFVGCSQPVAMVLPRDAAPMGVGATVCLSQESLQLQVAEEEETEEDGGHLYEESDLSPATMVVPEGDRSNFTGSKVPPAPYKVSCCELKVIFNEMCDLVEGSESLKKYAMKEMLMLHHKIMSMRHPKNIGASHTTQVEKSCIVSSNLPTEHLTIRKRKKGATG